LLCSSSRFLHDGKDINESVLAVDDKDAFAFLDEKFGCRVRVVAGGLSAGYANQVTAAALSEIKEFKA
jgi:hypothetical protein